MPNSLVIVAYPDLSQSHINAAWIAALRQEPAISLHALYGRYPDTAIDVHAERVSR
ncbi:hypothetical protein LG198_07350 [Methylobacillus arboreus]|uniref:hypothetical protein n=1 Tax=Methylobacillus arboreus TaxID=755170 RepID=UPI001E41716C|nr:hypothetical protein [Methylobacillus arboreus]MCB5190538.1 hypothetical protein [Methylobacillus arboreus]